jgi:hypothetical protein
LGSGRGEGGKLHFSSTEDREEAGEVEDSREEEDREDSTHVTSGESSTSSYASP